MHSRNGVKFVWSRSGLTLEVAAKNRMHWSFGVDLCYSRLELNFLILSCGEMYLNCCI